MSFEYVDDASIAFEQPGVDTANWPRAQSRSLGPVFELHHSGVAIDLSWLDVGRFQPSLQAMFDRETYYREARFHDGVIASHRLNHSDTDLTDFSYRARRAAIHSGFTKSVANQLVAAIVELSSNIEEHSEAVQTGYVAFSGGDGVFEFVVGDRGVGVLNSLRRNPKFSELSDAGTALELALTEGVSRHVDVGRGRGFRPLLVGLANESIIVRFRSSDHARQLDRQDDGSIPAKTSQKANFPGFMTFVRCES